MVKLVGSVNLDTIRVAHERIRPYIHRTPVLTNSWLNDACRASLFFKCENFQKVGAFKHGVQLMPFLRLMMKPRDAAWRRILPVTTVPQWRAQRNCAESRRIS